MSIRSSLAQYLRPCLDSYPGVLSALRNADATLGRAHHAVASHVPAIIQPTPEVLFISITGQCNYRCIGCRYERDFMLGKRLSVEKVEEVMADAVSAGVTSVRLYGGEPLLHPDLARMIRSGSEMGLDVYVTTNASLLDQRIDELYEAGLRWLTIGYYGHGDVFGAYTQRPNLSEKVEKGLGHVRERYGREQLEIQLNFVFVRPLATREVFDHAWGLTCEHDLVMHFDLYGYSIPFFTSGPNDELEFRPEDELEARDLVRHIVELSRANPERFPHSEPFLHSIPDWVMKKSEMRIPCDAYRYLWVGPDGSVQLCDTAFPLGNVHETPLREIVFGEKHRAAARGAFELKCPNCTCQVEDRIRKHGPSWRHYSKGVSL